MAYDAPHARTRLGQAEAGRQLEPVQRPGQGEGGKLTDDELDQLEGRRDQLVGRLQERTGERREAIEKDLDEMSRRSQYTW